jgi:hypothetical protein
MMRNRGTVPEAAATSSATAGADQNRHIPPVRTGKAATGAGPEAAALNGASAAGAGPEAATGRDID